MTNNEKIERGEQAKALAENPLLKKAIAVVKQSVFEEWEDAKTPEDREDLWNFQQAVTRFEKVLLGYIQTGEIARKQLLSERTFTQKVRRTISG